MPICTMPDRLGSSVDVSSSARAHRRQRMTATWTGGRVVGESMKGRTGPGLVELDSGRTRSEPEKEGEADEEEDDEDEDEVVPVYGTVGGRVADDDMMCVLLKTAGQPRV